jgi:hypothetical protein
MSDVQNQLPEDDSRQPLGRSKPQPATTKKPKEKATKKKATKKKATKKKTQSARPKEQARSAGAARKAVGQKEFVGVTLFEDEDDQVPLAGHPLTVTTPAGKTFTVVTNEEGYCEVPDGSTISSDEASGVPIEPYLVSTRTP